METQDNTEYVGWAAAQSGKVRLDRPEMSPRLIMTRGVAGGPRRMRLGLTVRIQTCMPMLAIILSIWSIRRDYVTRMLILQLMWVPLP